MKRRTKLALAAAALLVMAGALLWPVDTNAARRTNGARVSGVDLTPFPATGPTTKTDLLFIHHSCGGQWLAAPGPVEGERATCVYARHPNGGDLRARLEASGYAVHEASYGSAIGEKTDLFDWLPKFKSQMDKVLVVDGNDRLFTDGRTNKVVVFKSCFPNSAFVGAGTPPGNPAGPELTVANAKATMTAVLAELAKRPDVLFVYVTAPPLAPEGRIPAWKALARAIRGKTSLAESGALARSFNDWMKSPDGWLKGYPRSNVVVFDYFDALTDEGATDVAAYPASPGDSHPSTAGNTKATETFVPFVNRAFHRFLDAERG